MKIVANLVTLLPLAAVLEVYFRLIEGESRTGVTPLKVVTILLILGITNFTQWVLFRGGPVKKLWTRVEVSVLVWIYFLIILLATIILRQHGLWQAVQAYPWESIQFVARAVAVAATLGLLNGTGWHAVQVVPKLLSRASAADIRPAG